MFKFIASALALALAFNGVNATTSLRAADDITDKAGERELIAPAAGFLVSKISPDEDWCLTAAYGATEFKKLGFRKCDFAGAPTDQLFSFDVDGKLHSSVDPSKCMVLNHGDALFDGVRMRLADCGLPTLLNKFVLEGENLEVKLPFEFTPPFCITNRGPRPHNGDTIHAKKCKDRGDYKWMFVGADSA